MGLRLAGAGRERDWLLAGGGFGSVAVILAVRSIRCRIWGTSAGVFTGRVLRDAFEQARGLSCTVLVEGSSYGTAGQVQVLAKGIKSVETTVPAPSSSEGLDMTGPRGRLTSGPRVESAAALC